MNSTPPNADSPDVTLGELDAMFSAARERVPGFVRAHLGLRGSLVLHRHVIGRDLLVAPLNLLLSAPCLLLRITSMVLGLLRLEQTSQLFGRLKLFLPTRSGAELQEKLCTELLDAPALRELLGRLSPDRIALFDTQLDRLLDEYLVARAAVAEFVGGLVLLTTGLFVYQDLTPGAFTLAPNVAFDVAQMQAVEAFAFGPWAGEIWYGFFPASVSWSLIAGLCLAILLSVAVLVSVIGIVLDPLQRALGLHRFRLNRLVSVCEQTALGDKARGLRLVDGFLPRLVDGFEGVLVSLRLGA